MTYIPQHIPLWTWTLFLGEDGVFFSQPTEARIGGERWCIAEDGACVARCALVEFPLTDAGTPATPPMQCGHVASIDPDGDYLCHSHTLMLWHCEACYVFLPDKPPSPDGLCPACAAVSEAEDTA